MEYPKTRHFYDRDNEDAENFHKNEFRRPRNTLLNMVGDFVARCSTRLVELNKKSQDGKNIELLDSKCHVVNLSILSVTYKYNCNIQYLVYFYIINLMNN